jgi:hypothetical protein
MAWFADLSPCSYFGAEHVTHLRSVGWLERNQPFATGAVDREVFDQLKNMLKDPWQTVSFFGFHECDLCLYQGDARSVNNLFIPGDGIIFVCPELITHYMNAHGYQPPGEFCRAVLSCPTMRSVPYLRALLACGAGSLVKMATV